MSDEWVMVASFSNPLAAQMVMGRLEDEGIESFSTGDLSAAPFRGCERDWAAPSKFKCAAHERSAHRALIAEWEGYQDSEWESPAEAENVWVCSLCGEPIPDDRDVCPPVSRPATPSAPRSARPPSAHGPLPPRTRATHRGGSKSPRSRRLHRSMSFPTKLPRCPIWIPFSRTTSPVAQFRAALFGVMTTVFLFNLYSLWLSLRLCLDAGRGEPAEQQPAPMGDFLRPLHGVHLVDHL